MMQRLRDQIDSKDPTTARAAALLAAVPPLDPKRVRAWMHPLAVTEGARRAARIGRVRVAVAGALTFASLAAAAASAHRAGWFGASPSESRVAERAEVTPAAAPVGPAVAPPVEAPPVAAPPLAASSPPASSPPAEEPPPPSRRATFDGPAREPGGAVSKESVLMVQAVRALRRDGDPARAQALAEETLRRYPKGAQVEEAMALAMEAASARGDQAGARRAAARYLDRYPVGRFADRARRVISGSRDGQ